MLKMSYLVTETGYSRQWISKKASEGKIPGAFRRLSGRWSFPDSPELQKWISQLQESTSNWKVRSAYRAEYAIQALYERRAAVLKRFGTPIAKMKQQLSKLNEEIKAAEGSLKHYLTCREIAAETGRSKRWVEKIASKIPGVTAYKNRWVFYKSDALSRWLKRERNAMLGEKRRNRTHYLHDYPKSIFLLLRTQQLRFLVDRTLRHEPLEFWSDYTRETMLKEFIGLCRLLERHPEQ